MSVIWILVLLAYSAVYGFSQESLLAWLLLIPFLLQDVYDAFLHAYLDGLVEDIDQLFDYQEEE